MNPRYGRFRSPGVGGNLGSGTWSSITAPMLGELNAGILAIQVQRHTGMTTTADDIIRRCASARVCDERGGTDPIVQAKLALATAITGGASPTETAGALLNTLDPLYREFGYSQANGKLIAIMDALGATGADMALAAVAQDLISAGGSVLGEAASSLVDAISSMIGDSGWIHDVASVISDAVVNITKFMPYLAAVVRTGMALAEFVNSFWGPIRGASVNAGAREWCDFGPRLYAELARLDGLDAGRKADWTGEFSPFYYENTVYNANIYGLVPSIRCLDVHQYSLHGSSSNLPKWRHVLSGTAAHNYAWGNSDSLALVPGLNAENVNGCNIGTYPLTMTSPYRWSQNWSAFRAATIASLFINGMCCCINGVGSWVYACRGIAGRNEEDHECYNDDTPLYAIGYPWNGKKWWATWGEYHGWGREILLMPPSSVPVLPPDVTARGLGAMRRWWVDQLLARRTSWIPIQDMKDGHPELPRAGTAGSISTMQAIRASGVVRTFIDPSYITAGQGDGDKDEKDDTKWSTGTKVAVGAGVVGAIAGITKLLKLW
ncbi:MAG: hypothetical protein PHU54_05470 [Candidatus Omnitrophica bacterium]|nr:hypothetical protein [Candidatus Omnitrophota bacterium]